ncbi:MAG: Hpt domain-containing protein [Steroidobacteraceae bacterium]
MSEVSTQTLHVVARELNNELNDARVALELFGEQQDQVEVLAKCREHLRQVRGALRLVEVFGAALLVEEMEQLAQYLIDHIAEQRHLAEGLDALMRAMVQLPTYLERVMGGGRDMALVLLPLLNDLRAVRGNPLLSEGTLLLLNLSSDKQANPVAPAPGEAAMSAAHWSRRMRPRFQLGLLGWIKGERVDQNLEILARAAEKLEQVATTQPVFQLWWVIGAVVEALRDKGLEGTASVKRLLGQADRQMRRLYEQGEQHYCDQPPLDLLNNLLYYVARATSDGSRVAAVRASFRLNELLPIDEQVEAARESLSAPSIKLMKTVAGAIKEDLARVKDSLDIFVRRGGSQFEELAPQLELLKKIADTLGVLGLGELRERVQQQTTNLQQMLQAGTQPDETTLLAMAATLINVEDSLDEQLVGLIMPVTDTDADNAAAGDSAVETSADKDIEFRQVSEAVLRECIVNMARIKEAIALALEKPGEAQALDQIPHLMRGITAGLLMLGKSRAVEITERIRAALARHARPDVAPQMSEKMDRLADAIVAVEYYLETLQAGRSDPWYMLDNAESCLRALEALSTGATGLHRIPQMPAPSAAEATVVMGQPAGEHINVERTMVLGHPAGWVAAAQGVQRPANDHAATHPNLPPILVRPPDKSDPEFLELFIEEARDEIAKLNGLLKRWDDNPLDQDALTNLRRSFHTLKGSGRLVGAQLIGEFAWSIENLLNRVINKTLERTPEMMELLRQAVAVLPQLVEQLEAGRPPDTDVGPLIAQAHSLADLREHPRHGVVAATEATQVLQEEVAPQSQLQTQLQLQSQSQHGTEAPSVPVTMDPTLHDIFAKEVAGHLAAIREYINGCDGLLPPYAVTESLHRACHTLSGASKTAGARQSIKIAEPLNHYIRKLYDNGAALPAAGLQLLKDAVAAIEHILANINESTVFFSSQDDIAQRLQALEQRLDGELTTRDVVPEASGILRSLQFVDTPETPMVSEPVVVPAAIEPAPTPAASGNDAFAFHDPLEENEEWIDLTSDDLQALLDRPLSEILSQGTESSAMTATLVDQTVDQVDDQAVVHVDTSAQNDADGQQLFIDETMQDESVIEVSGEPELEPITIIETAPWAANFTSPVLAELSDTPINAPSALPTIAQHGLQAPVDASARFNEVAGVTANPVVSEASHLQSSPPSAPAAHMASQSSDDDVLDEEFDADIAAIFTEEATELLEIADQSLQRWQADRSNSQHVHELKRAVHTLKGGARMAGIRAMGDLSHELESFVELLEQGAVPATPEVFDLLQASLDELNRMRDTVNQGRRVKPATQLLQRIRFLGWGETPVAAGADDVEPIDDSHTDQDTIVVEITDPVFESVVLSENDDQLEQLDAGTASGEPYTLDEEVIDLGGLSDDEPTDVIIDEEILLDPIAAQDLAEAAYGMSLAPLDEPAVEFDSVELVSTAANDVDASGETLQMPHLVLPESQQPDEPVPTSFNSDEPPTLSDIVTVGSQPMLQPLVQPEPITPDVEVAAPEVEAEPLTAAIALPPGRVQPTQERAEVARVDADLLDNLLNNAGEVSILRSRLEQQVSSLEFNLLELGRTTTRLKDQLRNLEIETEAQILHKYQDDSKGREDFDPLELDRYSTIQQFSRALAESVSDVDSIEGLLETMTRETQNLLLQQSRVVTELQNGLMRTRMVPFSRHTQRLTRLVRQVAGDVGKRVELTIAGAGGELDRQVLERMLPPFEHMLRNSVVHGIESPEERRARNKSETGTIQVGLHREGAEMVITLQDDGRGIDVNAIREKARAKGMISGERVLTDEEALQLILEPGFSTASTITQHAGRGVGMDVVVTEIKKLGGALFTESKLGEGVKFTIRLPFTLAISQSLLVRVGENEIYALPLATVEGVVRLPRAEVESHLKHDAPSFDYGGQLYKFQHLGAFIDAGPSVLPEGDAPVPVVLIKAGEHSAALVTDELIGNREIVVKSVGPQVSSIRGIAGATILGDGRVVIILDMGALVRSEWRARPEGDMAARGEDRRTFALVVDDSITVRRVTQRLLERHGMRVLTAKDGVDALEILQEHVPDVILLDIEMPRMDGYELATQVRSSERLADIPIVMITSRVSEKHRARAIEIGVNDYLGKPYQENQLLDAIEPLVQARRRKQAVS